MRSQDQNSVILINCRYDLENVGSIQDEELRLDRNMELQKCRTEKNGLQSSSVVKDIAGIIYRK